MKKHRVRKLSPLWWAGRISVLLLLVAAVYTLTGASVALHLL